MADIRVLHLIKSLDIGGIETMALDFCSNAHRYGIEVHLFCMGGGEMEPLFKASPAAFIKRKKLPLPLGFPDPVLILRLRNYIKKNRIQIVHAHFADEGLHAFAAIKGLKNVALIQGFAVDFHVNRARDNMKFRFLAKYASGCVALSEVLLNQFREFGVSPGGSAAVVHNGIDPERVSTGSHGLLRAELGLPVSLPLGGMVGNFYNEVRDQLTVCKALAAAMTVNKTFHFVFAGGSTNKWIKKDEHYFESCVRFCRQAGIDDRVHFLGLRKDLADILAGLDFYVHATNYDTFGMAPVEAMFNKLPVIVNDHPVFRETSRNGTGMILFRSKDHEDLAGKITDLLADDVERIDTGLKHHDFARRFFHIDTHIHGMRAFYLECMNSLVNGSEKKY